MKMIDEKVRPNISIRINQDVLDEIDRFSKKLNISRGRLINNILEMGLCDARILEKVGLIDLAHIVRSFQVQVRKELRIA